MRPPDRTSTDAAISDHAGGGTSAPVPGDDDALGFLSAAARALSDTVLYEGYLLYPYRADALKNQQHWQFGVLMPPSFAGAGAGSGEHSNAHTEFLLDGGPDARLTVAIRWLWEHDGARGEAATALRMRLADMLDEPARRELTYTPPQPTPSTPAARGELLLDAQRLPGPYGGFRIRATVRNISAGEPPGAPDAAAGARDAALGAAFIGLQLVAHVAPGEFLSLADPPEWAARAAADCANERLWPALLGRPGRSDTLLAAPIILPDDPHLAAESPTSFCDATEIDEMLALRTATLTETEQRDARAGDPRAAELLDAVAELAPAMVEKLHGRTRIAGSDPARATPSPPRAPSPQLVEGAAVWVRPRRGRTDAQDMFVDGAAATVAAVLHDLDGRTHIAVTLDEDPGADLRREFGRFLYFSPDELEPR